MNKAISVTMFLALLLTACGQVKADVPDTTDAKATQIIVEEYILANNTHDDARQLSLFADDYTFVDNGLNETLTKGELEYYIKESQGEEVIRSKFESYLVTSDGHFAVLETTLSMKAFSTGKWVRTHATAILKIQDGKIVNETWYYNGTVFH